MKDKASPSRISSILMASENKSVKPFPSEKNIDEPLNNQMFIVNDPYIYRHHPSITQVR